MTAALTASPRTPGAHREPPAWLAAADARQGIRVRIDGATTLHTGLLAEPGYRADVVTEDCAVELVTDDTLLRFACAPDDDGGDPPLPSLTSRDG
jgi:hypothetical protein